VSLGIEVNTIARLEHSVQAVLARPRFDRQPWVQCVQAEPAAHLQHPLTDAPAFGGMRISLCQCRAHRNHRNDQRNSASTQVRIQGLQHMLQLAPLPLEVRHNRRSRAFTIFVVGGRAATRFQHAAQTFLLHHP